MSENEWLESNGRTIMERLKAVQAMPDGVVHTRPGSLHELIVKKEEGRLYLYFHGELGMEIQARMELDNPLHLLSPYAQIVMLSILWNPDPKRVYVLGFGGGRIPMIFHHHFPNAAVECTETDKDVVDVATQYFGVARDDRMRIIVRDGRRYLAERTSHERYDIILTDAFDGVGNGPYALATKEFFALCRQHLTENGVAILNLLASDSLLPQKLATFTDAFETTYRCRDMERGNIVLFGLTRGAAENIDQLAERAQALQETHQFRFPYAVHAKRLELLPKMATALHSTGASPLLSDAGRPGAPSAAKVGRNDDCPCGSGKKYKKCHGVAA